MIKRIKNKMWVINTLLFMLVFGVLFVQVSYMFRPASHNRGNIVGYYSEPSNTIDVVFIGGSSTYVFWAPLEGYRKYGISSYDFSTDAMSPALLKNMILEAEKTQNPLLYVIDMRAFAMRETYPEYYSEAFLRIVTDSFDYSLNRINTIQYSFDVEHPELTERLSLFFDLILYHSRWQELDKEDFEYVFNRKREQFKGFLIDTQCHQELDIYDWSKIQDMETLSTDTEKVLIDLLDFCREKDIKVLFTVNAYCQSTPEDKMRYNYMKRVVEDYGYAFLNTNDYYEEIGIDFTRDFYDVNHVNIYGAEKYTYFLGDYIMQHYEIPDRRSESLYAENWNEQMKPWDEAVAIQKQKVDNAINGKSVAQGEGE